MTHRRLRLRVGSEPELTRALIDVSATARSIGLPDYDTQAIATCVSELGRNILKYARSGEMIIEEVSDNGKVGIRVTAQDRGPGIDDVQVAMTDHYSSGGTLGLGLPGVKRMMHEFAIESAPGKGTRVVICLWRGHKPILRPGFYQALATQAARRSTGQVSAAVHGPAEASARIECAYCGRPIPGDRVSGDVAILEWRSASLLVAVVDGLGHGMAAHRVAVRAESYLRQAWGSDLAATLSGLHSSLQGTVGAVSGLCVIESGSGRLTFAGVGNTVFRIFGTVESRLESVAGILGQQIRTPRIQTSRLNPGDTLVAYTDGITGRFEYGQYPQLRYQNVRIVSEQIVNRFGKDHDDVVCAVARYKG